MTKFKLEDKVKIIIDYKYQGRGRIAELLPLDRYLLEFIGSGVSGYEYLAEELELDN